MTCSDIIQHIRKEHGFSESNIKDTLKTNANFYKNSFEKIKWLRKNPKDIILVERLNRKDVKRIKVNPPFKARCERMNDKEKLDNVLSLRKYMKSHLNV